MQFLRGQINFKWVVCQKTKFAFLSSCPLSLPLVLFVISVSHHVSHIKYMVLIKSGADGSQPPFLYKFLCLGILFEQQKTDLDHRQSSQVAQDCIGASAKSHTWTVSLDVGKSETEAQRGLTIHPKSHWATITISGSNKTKLCRDGGWGHFRVVKALLSQPCVQLVWGAFLGDCPGEVSETRPAQGQVSQGTVPALLCVFTPQTLSFFCGMIQASPT